MALPATLLLLAAASADARAQSREITVTNRCAFTVWIAQQPNAGVPALPGGVVRLATGAANSYAIPDAGWAGRFWPKTGCANANGTDCATGETLPPCPPGGCQPPADSKVEFFFPDRGLQDMSWYDISLVDGYSLPFRIAPRGIASGSCIETVCSLSLDACPRDEIDGLGDLRVVRDGATVQCLSPCNRWNYPAPYGLNRPETQPPGVDFCCPTPPVSVAECRAGPIEQSLYVQTVRSACPSAYSFAYDDQGGLHSCPETTSFDVTLCP
jgi:hypothetical protein